MINKGTILFLVAILLNGCGQKSIIEDIQIIHTMGYDYVDEETIKGTAALSVYGQAEKESSVENVSITKTAHSANDMKNKLQDSSSLPIRKGKMQTILYNDQLAEKGVYEFIDYYSRASSIGRKVNLIVVKGSAEELLSQKYDVSPNVSLYLRNMIKQNLEQNFPTSNFHEFLYSYYGAGMDPFMPVIQVQGNKINLVGTALFDEDQFVETIDNKQTFIMKMLYEPLQNGSYEFEFDEEISEIPSKINSKYIVSEALNSKVSYTIEQALSSPLIHIDIQIKGRINEAVTLTNPQNLDEVIAIIEKESEKHLKEEALKLLQHLQELNVDPLRIGDKARSQTRGWTQEKWAAVYPEATVDLQLSVQITQTGISK